ncbi:MAG: hypothetical protein GEV03_10595 [Streptosporangiales bacterium]|nr:hypothetical protein [Streptosporangiales bacterium]
MDPETERRPRGRLPADAYWRRRVLALVGLLVAVGGVAWVASGFGGEQQANSVGSRSTAAGVPAPQPTVTVTVTVTPNGSLAGFCADDDIEVKLLADQETYQAGTDPAFTIFVVNTGDAPCKRDVGPKALGLQVLSGGQVVWDSDHCADSNRADVRRLRPGEEYRNSVNWDRTGSQPGCAGERAEVGPGTYQLVGRAGGAVSKELTFYLE